MSGKNPPIDKWHMKCSREAEARLNAAQAHVDALVTQRLLRELADKKNEPSKKRRKRTEHELSALKEAALEYAKKENLTAMRVWRETLKGCVSLRTVYRWLSPVLKARKAELTRRARDREDRELPYTGQRHGGKRLMPHRTENAEEAG